MCCGCFQVSQRQKAQRTHEGIHGRRSAVTRAMGTAFDGHRPARGTCAAEGPRMSVSEHDERRGYG